MDTNWKPAQNPRRWPAFISSFLTCKLFCPLLHEGTTSDDNPDSGPERLWIEGHGLLVYESESDGLQI